ncbi:MAG: menaquinone biosynthesis protein [Vicinamibacterales bacterium]
MRPARLGAVSYLNTKPLVRGLERRPDLFTVRFDVPSICATLLHDGEVDLGLIPAIEYLRGDYALVPGVAIGSDGPVRSVAVFSRVPIEQVRSIALDTSSRTSVALTRILCARLWDIAPTFTSAAPDLSAMLDGADAALVIGDRALEADAAASGLVKTDLGEAWQSLTGLPFVYAAWTGRPQAVDADQVGELAAARARGVAAAADIAREVGAGDARAEARALGYLRDTLKYGLGDREAAGLERFHALAAELGFAPGPLRPLRFFP